MPGQQARERLIYVGETADRLGFRTFNPRTYKFSTEFELIFDENSLKDRGLALLGSARGWSWLVNITT